jgi:hypothetical protein
MPYYPEEAPGVLGSLAGAAATFFTTKQQLQDAELQRQYMQQQMQQAAAMAPLTLSKTQADIDETKAQTAYETMLTQPPDPAMQMTLTKGASMPTEPFVSPGMTIAAQVAAQHQYYQQLVKHLTGLNHQLATFTSMTPTPNVKDAIDSIKEEISETKAALSGVNADMRDLSLFGSQGQKPLTPQESIADTIARAHLGLATRHEATYERTAGATNKGPADSAAIRSAEASMATELRANRDPAARGEEIKAMAIQRGASTKTIDGIDAVISKYSKLWSDKNAGYGGGAGGGSAAAEPAPQRTSPPP